MTDRTAVLVMAALIAALALVVPPRGLAGPTLSPDPAQRLADRTAGWIAATLGTRPYPMLVNPAEQHELLPGASAQVLFATPTVIDVEHYFAEQWARMESARGVIEPEAAKLLVHELLHQDVDPTGDLYVEEAVVEAVAIDLMPAWSWQVLGIRASRWSPAAIYREHVANVRAWSTRYSGSRTWRDRDARLARRALLVADEPTRRLMLEAVR